MPAAPLGEASAEEQIPLWVRLSRRVGRKRLGLFGMASTTAGFTVALFLAPGAWVTLAIGTARCGIGLGRAAVLGPSVAADVVDYDEVTTDERKEGSYAAVPNRIHELRLAAAAGLAGFGLQLPGYDAAADVRKPGVQRTILWCGGEIPALAYGLALLAFSRFRLDDVEHARVQAEARAMRDSADGEDEAVRS